MKLQIVKEKHGLKTTFRELEPGDVFKYNAFFYIKRQPLCFADGTNNLTAYCFSSNYFCEFPDDAVVYSIEATLYIKDIPPE